MFWRRWPTQCILGGLFEYCLMWAFLTLMVFCLYIWFLILCFYAFCMCAWKNTHTYVCVCRHVCVFSVFSFYLIFKKISCLLSKKRRCRVEWMGRWGGFSSRWGRGHWSQYIIWKEIVLSILKHYVFYFLS